MGMPATLLRADKSLSIASSAPRAIPITGPEKILFAPHIGGTRNMAAKFSDASIVLPSRAAPVLSIRCSGMKTLSSSIEREPVATSPGEFQSSMTR